MENETTLFEYIFAKTDEELISAIAPFVSNWDDPKSSFREIFLYDYTSLFVLTLHKVLKIISENLTDGIDQSQIKRQMSTPIYDVNNWNAYQKANNDLIYSSCISEKDRNRKFYQRLDEKYTIRNEEHLRYLSMHEKVSSKLYIEDALYYSLLRDFPLFKRFLLNDKFTMENAITFFDDLERIYEDINENCTGYDRFDLYRHFESDCKIEMYYKLLLKIKINKRKYKLPDDIVKRQLDQLYKLHVVPYIPHTAKSYFEKTYPLFQNPIHELQGNTINDIVFGIDDLLEDWQNDSEDIITKFQILNYIQNTVVATASTFISNHLLSKYDFKKIEPYERFLQMRKILSCEKCEKIFSDYLDQHTHIVLCKNITQDITLNHFKRVYNIKKEKRK